MPKLLNQGRKANISGQLLEKTTRTALQGVGFEIAEHIDDIKRSDIKLAIPNVPFRGIYGHKGRSEWVIWSPDGANPTSVFPTARKGVPFECRIECKNQMSPGSVDEKFPYVILNAEEKYGENFVLLVFQTPGAKKEANQWIADAVKKQSNGMRRYQVNPNKEIALVDNSGFTKWVLDAFC